MTTEELQMLLTLRSTLSEYEHFMSQLSAMVEKGVDIPLVGVMPFPMRDKLYKQVRDLVLGKSAMVGETTAVESKFTEGELVRDILSKKVYRVFKTDMVALKLAGDPDDTAPINLHESCIEKV